MPTVLRVTRPNVCRPLQRLGLSALVSIQACSAGNTPRSQPTLATARGAAGAFSGMADSGTNPDLVSMSGGAGTIAGDTQITTPSSAMCTQDGAYKAPGCACEDGAAAACWTGPLATRNTGACHDGMQKCIGAEFGWGPCVGEEQNCGDAADAGEPDAGHPACPCVPGAMVYCDEDCTVNIMCIPWSNKVCLPNGTWGPCREAPMPADVGQTIALAGWVASATLAAAAKLTAKALAGDAGPSPTAATPPSASNNTGVCGNVFHGCASGPPETWGGDCSKQFTCGHAPD
jgi:hypothetical protein